MHERTDKQARLLCYALTTTTTTKWCSTFSISKINNVKAYRSLSNLGYVCGHGADVSRRVETCLIRQQSRRPLVYRQLGYLLLTLKLTANLLGVINSDSSWFISISDTNSRQQHKWTTSLEFIGCLLFVIR